MNSPDASNVFLHMLNQPGRMRLILCRQEKRYSFAPDATGECQCPNCERARGTAANPDTLKEQPQ